MTGQHNDNDMPNSGRSTRGGQPSQDQLEMAQRIARDMLRDDHHAFQISVRNDRD